MYMMGRECQQGLWLMDVKEEMEEINLALGSSPPLPPHWEQDHLSSGSPLPPHLLPPPGLIVGEEKKSASPWLAPWSGAEGI